ncbi:GNAT family N-acetyltransferase [Staphylococcus sp. SQ8-PEA]|uniref:GNAT family N-acetyltransferase n=1 Tax=Staphylococcus marylandisciuri TaxID=2981529 RepID=A0ABT2QSG6_9STAP|nr:GNAT family N-acetyltransferase [Staphylococcus marylandisciuri]MCU5746877.1 GNAT family N-acetyltransferase [Staphylococcus marylandisciuri]
MPQVRKATEADVVGIRDVATKAWYSTYLNIYAVSTVNELLAASYNEQNLLNRLKDQLFLVIEENDEIIAFSNFIYGKELYLSAHYVCPGKQNKGFGGALLQAGLDIYQDQYEELYVEVDRRNESAVRFYKNNGFEHLRSYDQVMYGEIMELALLRKSL